MVNVLRSKKMMQKTLTITPAMKRSEVVKDLLGYAIRLGGVEEGSRKAQLQQQVTGKRSVRGWK